MKEYFSHDYTSRTDPKIKRLIAQHGMAGYGIFWAIIEDLYVNTNVLPSDYDCIAFDLRTTPEIIDSIINDFGLFINDGTNISSTSVERRLDERKDKSIKARESVKKRWEKYERNTNVIQPQYDSNTIKEKEIKEKKENNSINTAKLFYEAEIENNITGKYINEYKMTINYLMENPILNSPVYHVLKIKKQLTYNQFENLILDHSFEKFKDKLKVWVNNASYSKGKITIYQTIDNWCKNK